MTVIQNIYIPITILWLKNSLDTLFRKKNRTRTKRLNSKKIQIYAICNKSDGECFDVHPKRNHPYTCRMVEGAACPYCVLMDPVDIQRQR